MQVLLAIEDLLKESLQENESEEIKNQISEEFLQEYANKFRKGFGFFFEESFKWNISYQDLQNDFLLLYFEGKEKEEFAEEIQQYEGDFEAILAEDEGDFSEVEEIVEEKGKAVLYLESSFFIVKKILEENWTEEKASEDCSEELGKVLAKLPEKKNTFVETLQTYADKFRKVLTLLSKNKSWNVKYSTLENGICLHFFRVEKNEFSQEIVSEEEFEENLIERNKMSIEDFHQTLTNNKTVKLYEEKDIFIIKTPKDENWTAEEASKDAKEELDKVLAKLPENQISEEFCKNRQSI